MSIKRNMKAKLFLLVLVVLMISCKTYTISPENFKKQMIDNNANNVKDVKVNNPLSQFSSIDYKANSLKYLNVYDKHGTLSFMQNSPSIEMSVTLKNGKRKIFYLDTVTLENDTLKGEKSRILGIKDKVSFNEIAKIEVQDGGKNYQYTTPTKEERILENSDKIFDNRGEVLELFDFKMDTISIKVDKYNGVYYAACKFEKSQSEVSFLYYLNNNLLELITTREISLYENEIWWINRFYVENNNIFSEKSYCLPKSGNEIPKSGKYKDYKFNKNLNSLFLKKLSFEIYNTIKNHR
jgi:hypothetical protein